MPKQNYKSFVKSGKGLGLAKKLRLIFEEAGYYAMPISEYTSAIRAGRYPAGTLAFAVVDERSGKPRLPGTVVITSEPVGVMLEGDEDDVAELRSVLEG